MGIYSYNDEECHENDVFNFYLDTSRGGNDEEVVNYVELMNLLMEVRIIERGYGECNEVEWIFETTYCGCCTGDFNYVYFRK